MIEKALNINNITTVYLPKCQTIEKNMQLFYRKVVLKKFYISKVFLKFVAE